MNTERSAVFVSYASAAIALAPTREARLGGEGDQEFVP